MGYLNNSTRILDAILTKKGREILSSGGDFEVTKFALGDDEVDYALWDTTHTQGTDYYGAVIDNLPALEPFNDPSEIMKYKLVTRQEGTSAMVKLNNYTNPGTNTITLNWYSDITSNSGISVNPSSPDPDNPTVPSDLILICEASANRGPSASSRINPVVFNSKVPPPEIVLLLSQDDPSDDVKI